MVIWYAARHQLAVPVMARCLLALGIVATLAANVAHGWSHGPVGAVVAAWPAVSLVGTFELLLWIIRATAASAPVREAVADRVSERADHPAATLRLMPAPAPDGLAVHRNGSGEAVEPTAPNVLSRALYRGRIGPASQTAMRRTNPDRAANQMAADWTASAQADGSPEDGRDDINSAAVAAYRTSIEPAGPCPSASSPRCSARPPPLGPVTAWPSPPGPRPGDGG